MIAGRYSLDSEIGRGGMGVVWRGEDQVLGREVALKRIGLAPGGASTELVRAEREAKLAASLNHPNVVAVFDLVVEDDEHWLVMEHVPAHNLAALVRKRRGLPPDEAAKILGQAADGLAAAHEAGIVHRDVKPSNILVTDAGLVKLTDFGIARASQDATLTQTGMVTGSPAYMAPEVASGKSASSASDVWALGATLYHALAGKPPYEVKDNMVAALYRIVHEDPPRLPDAGWLAPVLEGTMATDPEQRWTMAQVRDYLLAGPDAAEVPAPTTTLPTRVAGAVTQQLPAVASSVATGVSSALTRGGDTAETAADPAPQGSTSTSASRGEGSRRRRTAWIVGAVAVLLGALVVFVALTVGSGEQDAPRAGQTPSGSPTPSSPSSSPSSSSPTSEAPSAEEMASFVEDYVNTAPQDRDTTWAQLTPGFQRASGGRQSYENFWSNIDSAEVTDISADPEAMTVTYSVTYQRGSGTIDDRVTLTLVRAGDSFKIAAES